MKRLKSYTITVKRKINVITRFSKKELVENFKADDKMKNYSLIKIEDLESNNDMIYCPEVQKYYKSINELCIDLEQVWKIK